MVRIGVFQRRRPRHVAVMNLNPSAALDDVTIRCDFVGRDRNRAAKALNRPATYLDNKYGRRYSLEHLLRGQLLRLGLPPTDRKDHQGNKQRGG